MDGEEDVAEVVDLVMNWFVFLVFERVTHWYFLLSFRLVRIFNTECPAYLVNFGGKIKKSDRISERK